MRSRAASFHARGLLSEAFYHRDHRYTERGPLHLHLSSFRVLQSGDPRKRKKIDQQKSLKSKKTKKFIFPCRNRSFTNYFAGANEAWSEP